MATVKEQLQAARDLIQTGRYSEARKALRRINHPTAQKWLEQLDQLEGKGGESRQSSTSRELESTETAPEPRRRAGCGTIIFRLLISIIVLTLVIGGYYLYTTGALSSLIPGAEPTQVALGPDGRPLPTTTPIPTPTPVPCEPQIWWDENDELFLSFINPDSPNTEEAYQEWLTELQENRSQLDAVAYPECLTTLVDRIFAVADSTLIQAQTPIVMTYAVEGLDALNSGQVREYGGLTLNSQAAMSALVTELDVQGIRANAINRTLVDAYTEDLASECSALTWVLIEYLPYSVLATRAEGLLNSGSDDLNEARSLMFDLQREGQRITGEAVQNTNVTPEPTSTVPTETPVPDCLSEVKQLMLDANRALAATLQSKLSDNSQEANNNRATYNDLKTQLLTELQQIPVYQVFGRL